MHMTDPEDLGGLTGWVAGVITDLGAVGVGLLVALENLIPPVPSELVLAMSGYLASEGRVRRVGVRRGDAGLGGRRAGALRRRPAARASTGCAAGSTGCRWSTRERTRPRRPVVRAVRQLGRPLRPDGAGGAQPRLDPGRRGADAAAAVPRAHRGRQRRLERAVHRARLRRWATSGRTSSSTASWFDLGHLALRVDRRLVVKRHRLAALARHAPPPAPRAPPAVPPFPVIKGLPRRGAPRRRVARQGHGDHAGVGLEGGRDPGELPVGLGDAAAVGHARRRRGSGRSRLTDQNASRARPRALAQSRICVQVAGVVSSCWSDRPFMPEMPMCGVGRARRTSRRRVLQRVLQALGRVDRVLVNMFALPPKSNGMMVKTSMFACSAAAWLISRMPQ